MTTHMIKKGNIKLTLSIEKKILSDFKKYCEEEGIIISKQIEKFMRSKLKEKYEK